MYAVARLIPFEKSFSIAFKTPSSCTRDGGKSEVTSMVGFAVVCQPEEVQLLDKAGELGVRVVDRLKILGVDEATPEAFRLRVVPHRDHRRAFRNAPLAHGNIEALHQLYDRCNHLELKLRQLQGASHAATARIEVRRPLHERVDSFLNEVDADASAQLRGPSGEASALAGGTGAVTQRVAELVSFLAMDYHIDARARCWAVEVQDTELRLQAVRDALEEKVKVVQGAIRDTQHGPPPQADPTLE
eukprot:GHVT01079388.1.p1 GENE.GHVT01079388.1~~GHVT01079388.1.p1  ORF type:complete len:245 (-),score=69.19 GHVT01079388.1:390-1124(-)